MSITFLNSSVLWTSLFSLPFTMKGFPTVGKPFIVKGRENKDVHRTEEFRNVIDIAQQCHSSSQPQLSDPRFDCLPHAPVPHNQKASLGVAPDKTLGRGKKYQVPLFPPKISHNCDDELIICPGEYRRWTLIVMETI